MLVAADRCIKKKTRKIDTIKLSINWIWSIFHFRWLFVNLAIIHSIFCLICLILTNFFRFTLFVFLLFLIYCFYGLWFLFTKLILTLFFFFLLKKKALFSDWCWWDQTNKSFFSVCFVVIGLRLWILIINAERYSGSKKDIFMIFPKELWSVLSCYLLPWWRLSVCSINYVFWSIHYNYLKRRNQSKKCQLKGFSDGKCLIKDFFESLLFFSFSIKSSDSRWFSFGW